MGGKKVKLMKETNGGPVPATPRTFGPMLARVRKHLLLMPAWEWDLMRSLPAPPVEKITRPPQTRNAGKFGKDDKFDSIRT